MGIPECMKPIECVGMLLVLLALTPVAGGADPVPPDIAVVDARYREQAANNTELHRKGDATIELLTADGRPLPMRQLPLTGKSRISCLEDWLHDNQAGISTSQICVI